MPLKLKTVDVPDKGTLAEVKDGLPVYLNDQGVEVAIDANKTADTITRLNNEAAGHRRAKEEAETKLKEFGEIEPAKAKAALETVAALDQNELVQAGKVQEIKDAAVAATKEQFRSQIESLTSKTREQEAAIAARTTELHREKLTNAFATSKVIAEKLAIPAVMAQKVFGDNFKVEDGKIVAYYDTGLKVYSQKDPGNEPDFEEALQIVIGAYPHKETILKGRGQSGGGGQGGEGGGPLLGDKTIYRSAFEKLDPVEQGNRIRQNWNVVDDARAA